MKVLISLTFVERHSEFSTYTFISDNLVTGSKPTNEIINLDAEWVSDISGEVISANHIDLRSQKMLQKMIRSSMITLIMKH